MPAKKEVVDKRNEIIRKLILTKLKTIRKEKFEPKTVDKFSLTYRVFLLRYLNLNYEFTLDELIKELNKRKISSKLKDKIIEIMNLLTEIEYENKRVSREEFKSLLSRAENIVNLATHKVEVKKEQIEKEEKTKIKKSLLFNFILNFIHKIGLAKTKEEKLAIKGEREKERKQKEAEKEKLKAKKKQEEKIRERVREAKLKEKRIKQIEAERKREEEERRKQIEGWKRKKLSLLKRKELEILPPPLPFPDIEAIMPEGLKRKEGEIQLTKKNIRKARTMLKKSKLNDAKRIYIEIIKTYVSLEPKDQIEVYNAIKKLYYERKKEEKRRKNKK